MPLMHGSRVFLTNNFGNDTNVSATVSNVMSYKIQIPDSICKLYDDFMSSLNCS